MSNKNDNENDIIITLVNYLEEFTESKFTISFSDTDTKLKFAEGSTAKYIEDAVGDANLVIVRQSDSQASLKKKPPTIFAIS